jgi:hypothetical protein
VAKRVHRARVFVAVEATAVEAAVNAFLEEEFPGPIRRAEDTATRTVERVGDVLPVAPAGPASEGFVCTVVYREWVG